MSQTDIKTPSVLMQRKKTVQILKTEKQKEHFDYFFSGASKITLRFLVELMLLSHIIIFYVVFCVLLVLSAGLILFIAMASSVYFDLSVWLSLWYIYIACL